MSLVCRVVCAHVFIRGAGRGRDRARRGGGSGAPSAGFSESPRSAAGRPTGGAAGVAAVVAASLILAVGTTPASADSCPNAQFRTGYSAYLPDCRAYEQVSPVDKNGTDIADVGGSQASPSGDSVVYGTVNAFGDARAAGFVTQLRSVRGLDGWSTRVISPPVPPGDLFTNPNGPTGSKVTVLSSDLSGAVIQTQPDPPALAGTQPSAWNFYRQLSVPDGQYELINPAWPEPSSSVALVEVVGASADLSHVLLQVFGGDEPLTPDTPPLDGQQQEMYDWSAGRLHLVGVLPGETVAPDGAQEDGDPGGMSSDGSRSFFESGGSVYVRINDASTMSVGSGTFWGATPDGSHAFYINGTGELFEFDVDTGKTTDIAPAAGLVGFGDDGKYVYYGQITGLDQGDLYAWHDGTSTLIASNVESDMWSNIFSVKAFVSEVSPNGRYLVFATGQHLTGFDNAGHQEVYRYDAQSATLDCVSCGAPGSPPATGDSGLTQFSGFDGYMPAPGIHHLRNVLDDGRVFFESPDPLVPADTNSRLDVYMWEDGHPHLISTGQSDSASNFVEASPSGDDVFFLTRQELVGADTDNNADLYDARADGGLASQNPPPAPPPCSGEDCKGPSSAPAVVPVAASVSFAGPGNVTSPASARTRVLTRVVRGPSFKVQVSVPESGRIAISGAGIRHVRRSVSIPGTYGVLVRLTAREKRLLGRRHRVTVRLHVAYTPAGGAVSKTTAVITVRPALSHQVPRAPQARRPAATSHGGVR